MKPSHSFIPLLACALIAVSCGPSITQIPTGDPRCPGGGVEVKDGNKDQIVCSNIAELVRIVPLSVGDAHCPAGGSAIETGWDNGADGGSANDGQLQPGEITNTQYQCNQGQLLTRETPLAAGDTHCPGGGTQIDVGFDNGANGGTANDGTLQPGEITSTEYVCSDNGLYVGSFVPPAGTAGTGTVNLSGGNGLNGSGGDGGIFLAYFTTCNSSANCTTGGTLGGHIKLFATGSVDAGFTAPGAGSPNLGVNPMNVTGTGATVLWRPDLSGTGLTTGQYFFSDAGSYSPLYQWTGTSVTAVTSVSIASGATLTFQTDPMGQVNVQIGGPWINSGTLTVQPLSDGSRRRLVVLATDYYGALGSKVDMHGADAVGADGGAGGLIGIVGVDLNTRLGSVINLGTIDAHGGSGDNGGAGGVVIEEAYGPVYSSGDITANGGAGNGLHGTGGNAGIVDLVAFNGPVNASGNFSSNGGNGQDTGGSGSFVAVASLGKGGDVRAFGSLSSGGGSASPGCLTGCRGGSGGRVLVEAQNGSVALAADVNASGGAGAGGPGGPAGVLQLLTAPSGNSRPGGIAASGNWNLAGGSGANGGRAGVLQAAVNPGRTPAGQEIQLVGFGGGVNLQGGSGTVGGGQGGAFLAKSPAASLPANTRGPGGSILSTCNINTSGGNGANGPGGNAGAISWQTDQSQGFAAAIEKIINAGTITANGGNGSTTGGSGGAINWYGMNGVMSSGNISTGAGTGGTGNGGAGGNVSLLSDIAPIMNAGSIQGSGGDSTSATGGAGSAIVLNGQTVTNAGDLLTTGGNGTAGGAGGNVTVLGVQGNSTNSGRVTTHGGTGTPPGAAGIYTLDGHVLSAN